MKKTFPASNVNSETVDKLLDLVSLCLNIEPRHRPEVSELLDHPFFEGHKENVESMPLTDKMSARSEEDDDIVGDCPHDGSFECTVEEIESLSEMVSERNSESQSLPVDGRISPARISLGSLVEKFERLSVKDDPKCEVDIERAAHDDVTVCDRKQRTRRQKFCRWIRRKICMPFASCCGRPRQ